MDVTYFGHSALQLDLQGAVVLVDPFISGNPKAGDVTAADLHPDVLLLTHAHFDHFGDTPAILEANPQTTLVGNFEISGYAERQLGHTNCIGINIGGGVSFDWGRVTTTPALHSSSFPDGTYGGNPCGYILESNGKTVYLAGDTAPFAEMAWLGEDFDIDIAFLPIGDLFTMGPVQSVRAAKMLQPDLVVPIHYNTFDAINVDTDAWIEMINSAGLEARIVPPGETIGI